MSLVKWVIKYELFDYPSKPKELQIPVIPLAALTEVVEGLTSNFHSYELKLLAHHAGLTEEQLCGAAIALRWVETQLKAQLEGHTEKEQA